MKAFISRIFLVGLALVVFSCSPKGDKKKGFYLPENAIEKVVDTYPTGSPKVIEYYIVEHGIERIHAFSEFYLSGETRIQGLFSDSKKRSGLWESFYEDGKKWSEGYYLDGIENGIKQVWYESGKLRYTGEVKDGKPIGDWYFWDEAGNKTLKSYKD